MLRNIARVAAAHVAATSCLRRVGDTATVQIDTAERSCLAATHDWIESDDIGEVRRLRVDPDWRRRGVTTALMRELIRFSAERSQALRTLVVNTTSAQRPALALYRKLGFREVGRCYVDTYELVWMRREVQASQQLAGVGLLE